MTAIDYLRMIIIAGAFIVGVLWIYYAMMTHYWVWTLVVLCWLVPVMVFFIIKFVCLDLSVYTLNIISMSLYLIGIAALGGVVIAKIKTIRENRGVE